MAVDAGFLGMKHRLFRAPSWRLEEARNVLNDLHPPPRCGTQTGSNMSHVVQIRLAESMAAGSLAGLIDRQMSARLEAMPVEVPSDPGMPVRAREWKALVEGLWRAAGAARGKATADRLPWAYAVVPAALFRELLPI